ncbi:MAG: alanine racemase [Ilumatobacteraceae bacterium]
MDTQLTFQSSANPATIHELATPALIIDLKALDRNIAAMSAIRPGTSLRPHVKATKCTVLARRQAKAGHLHFTCATIGEMVGMADAGLGTDLLLANEVLDIEKLELLARAQDNATVTVAIDSDETLRAIVMAGIKNVLIDVNVGLPRCGCDPSVAGALADRARHAGLNVRGVMGYEGHLMMVTDRAEQRRQVEEAMAILRNAAADVGGDIISGGGTGSCDLHETTGVTEVQAGSYSLMDSQYSKLGLPFEQAMWILGTVISRTQKWSVINVGLKSLCMDHGNPSVPDHSVWFCSDEHTTIAAIDGPQLELGSQVRVTPAHIDPTIAMHESAWILNGDAIVDRWKIDLRGW